MNDHKERLTILSDQEWSMFYAFPDFTEEQRVDYFIFNQQELDLIFLQPSPEARVYCALQLAYFKAKQSKLSLSSIGRKLSQTQPLF